MCLAWSGAVQGAETIGLDLEPTVEVRRWQAPRFTYGNDDVRGSLISQQVGQFAAAPGVRISYEPGRMFVMPHALGDRFRYRLSYRHLDDTATSIGTFGPGTNPTLVGVGGSASVVMLTPARTTVQVDHAVHDFNLGIATDYDFVGDFSVGAALGVTFGQSRQRYRVLIEEVSTFRDSVSETVRRRYVGPSLGFQFGWDVLDGLRLHAGLGSALLWSQATLQGDDCAGSAASTFCDGFFLRTNLDRSYDSWGWRSDANVGLAVALGPATATIEGIFDAEYARQRISNPRTAGTGRPPSSMTRR